MKHSDNTAVALLEIQDGQVKVVYADDNSHLTPEISTLARQNWWKDNPKAVDLNLWFSQANLDTVEDRDFYLSCREEAWRRLYGRVDQYDGPGSSPSVAETLRSVVALIRSSNKDITM